MNVRAVLAAFGSGACTVSLALSPLPAARESVRTELDHRQQQTGLTLATVESGRMSGVVFRNRTMSPATQISQAIGSRDALSPDGSRLAFQLSRETGKVYRSPIGRDIPLSTYFLGIIRTDGSELREYPGLQDPYDVCWSYDNSLLAVHARNPEKEGQVTSGLKILEVVAGNAQEIEVLGYLTTQCWDPGGKELVYETEGNLKIYDLKQRVSRVLAKGRRATWAPNGEWIAFLDGNKYYAVRPSGGERKVLFKQKGALTPLWWSPDSRFVAYESYDRFFEGTWWPPAEQARLRVRRLEDNAEDWVANLYVEGHVPQFQWINAPGVGRP